MQTTGLALVKYELRRVGQTRRTFVNWPTLLRQMVGEKLGRGTDELQFVTRRGPRITTPNVPGARLPLYEQFADDAYRHVDLLAPLLAIYFAAVIHRFAAAAVLRQCLIYAAIYCALMTPWWIHNYATYGTFFDTGDVPNFANGGTQFTDPRSVSPARPRTFYAGLKATF